MGDMFVRRHVCVVVRRSSINSQSSNNLAVCIDGMSATARVSANFGWFLFLVSPILTTKNSVLLCVWLAGRSTKPQRGFLDSRLRSDSVVFLRVCRIQFSREMNEQPQQTNL